MDAQSRFIPRKRLVAPWERLPCCSLRSENRVVNLTVDGHDRGLPAQCLHQSALHLRAQRQVSLQHGPVRHRQKEQQVDQPCLGIPVQAADSSVHPGKRRLHSSQRSGPGSRHLSLAKKLVAANADQIGAEVEILSTEIKRRDGKGTLRILPAQNAVGQHGKTAAFIGYDEIHGYKNYDLFEALAPDPTRPDSLIWITSYDTIYNSPGIPLRDAAKLPKVARRLEVPSNDEGP